MGPGWMPVSSTPSAWPRERSRGQFSLSCHVCRKGVGRAAPLQGLHPAEGQMDRTRSSLGAITLAVSEACDQGAWLPA